MVSEEEEKGQPLPASKNLKYIDMSFSYGPSIVFTQFF